MSAKRRLDAVAVWLVAITVAILFAPFFPSIRPPRTSQPKQENLGIKFSIVDTLAGESIGEYWINGKPSRYWKAKKLGDDVAFIEGRA